MGQTERDTHAHRQIERKREGGGGEREKEREKADVVRHAIDRQLGVDCGEMLKHTLEVVDCVPGRPTNRSLFIK